MKVESFACGNYLANGYILTDEDTGKSIMIDAPFEAERLIKRVAEIKYDMQMILITHRHIDHLAAAARCKALTLAVVYIHRLDECGLYSVHDSLASALNMCRDSFSPIRADLCFEEEETVIPFGSHDIRVLHTPGHTSGGVCYIIDDMLFSGDTLFKESVGRTDFPSGNSDDLKTSLQRLYLLKGDYKVFPGHGDTTTLSYERENNPYIKEAIIL